MFQPCARPCMATEPPSARSSGPDDASEISVHEGLEALQRQQANLLRGRLCLEHHRFLGEGIDALTRLRGGLLDDFHLQQARQREHTVATETLLDDAIE